MTDYEYRFKELVELEREGRNNRVIEVGIQRATGDDDSNWYLCLRHLLRNPDNDYMIQKKGGGVLTFPSDMTDDEAAEVIKTIGQAFDLSVTVRPF